MLRIFTVIVALLLAATVASAADLEGKVKSWDGNAKILTLEDGTQLSLPADVKAARDRLTEGATVKVSFEEKEGKKIVTSIMQK